MRLTRRHILGGALGASAALSFMGAGCKKPQGESEFGPQASKPKGPARKRMALTFDDFGLDFETRLTALERDAAILAALEKHNVQAAGFVTGSFVDRPDGDAILKRWGEAGHILANHTWSHENASEKPTAWTMDDIRRNHEALKGYKGFQPYFRFPFLAEGGAADKITEYRAAIKALGYKRAPVSLDTIDWNVSARLEAYLKANPQGDISAYRDYYVKSCVTLANHFHAEAQTLLIDDWPHQTLMHHNILNALCLDDVISAWKADGWEIIPAQQALDAPVYQSEPATPTRGRSLLSVLIYEERLLHPPFPVDYPSFGNNTMDALGL